MRRLLFLLPLLGVTACTAGPDYAGPPVVISAGAPPVPFVRDGGSAAAEAPTRTDWWTTLSDPMLDDLETRALAGNPNIAVARARLRQARAGLRGEAARALPDGSARAAYVHAHLPGIDLEETKAGQGLDAGSLDFYAAGFDASWEVDLFGGQRRSVEAASADLAAAEANVADAQVSLSAEVAEAYVNLRERQHRVALARQIAGKQHQILALERQRLERGTASALDIERLRGLSEEAERAIVALDADIDGYRDALAVLTGAVPGTLDAMLSDTAAIPLPPARLAVGDPAALLQRRPDIRAAERRLAAQTARIGVATAARFPELSLRGVIGLGSAQLSGLGDISAIVAPSLQWSFLDFGRTAARVDRAQALRDEAAAQYKASVLGALRDAEGALSRFAHQRDNLASITRSRDSATRASGLMQQRYRAGTASLIDALDAERQCITSEQSLSQAAAALTGEYIALQKSLGLGWSSYDAAGARRRQVMPR